MTPGHTVLVIDDDPDIVAAVTAALQMEGLEVESADDRHSALALLESSVPRVILLDYFIPGAEVHELARHALAKHPDAHVVLMTADNYPREKAHELGVRHFLAKPFELDDMLAMVRELAAAPSEF